MTSATGLLRRIRLSRNEGSGVRLLLIIGLFLAGLGMRLIDLTDPPLDFHVPRQIHSALIARGLYAENAPWLAEDLRGRMAMLGAVEIRIEPPILETITAWTWLALGKDYLWIPRLFSILFWVASGIPLYLMAYRLSGFLPGMVVLVYYLFLPYGAFASRSFQPDPLMVSLALYAAWSGLRWIEKPGWGWAAATGLLAGCAILVKQVIVFPLLGFFVGLIFSKIGLRKALKDPQVWLVAVLSGIPALAYNIYGIWGAGFLAGQYNQRFFPRLWIDPAFYLRWLVEIDQTVGVAFALAALLGFGLIPSWKSRGWLAGWWVGYLIYGLVFAHHISTHDYYQLPLIPVVALSLAPLAHTVWEGVQKRVQDRWMQLFALVALAGCLLFPIYKVRAELRRVDYRDEPNAWEKLGQELSYESSNVIGLFDDYGARMIYWSLITPVLWTPPADSEGALIKNYNAWQEEFFRLTEGKKYFVVSDTDGFNKQPIIRTFLEANYPVIFREKGYQVFDIDPNHP